MLKRIIFDLDNTILIWYPEYSKAIKNAFDELHVSYNERIVRLIYDSIKVYELNYNIYDVSTLTKFIELYIGTSLPNNFVKIWLKHLGNCTKINNKEEVIDTLNYLSKYELVVLTNFFTSSQKQRLINLDLDKYFKEIIGTDQVLNKPSKESFMKAVGNKDIEDCLMIGDNIEVDILGAQNLGMDTILVDYNDKHKTYKKTKIKKFNELKEIL